MHKFIQYFSWLLGAIILSRLIPMCVVPFTDPTEARYAEIARIMAQTGDWITPYFDYNVPFWGKPPLSFWAQAICFKLFGINDFAPRFPSWLVTLIIIGLIYQLLKSTVSRTAALFACAIFFSCILTYALSGAVITDPYLVLSVTLSLVAFVMVIKQKSKYWRYWFFIGMALGMLAKGPIAVILIAGPIFLWLIIDKSRWQVLRLFPWVMGIILFVVLTLPWYIAAELKTPGFLHYFIMGEHFYRFVDPGWTGDLYGSAHKHVKGYIWLLWLVASFPWGVIAIGLIIKRLPRPVTRQALWLILRDYDISFYLIWAVFTLVFFTIAGNVLWTYVLPVLPALAILLGIYFDSINAQTSRCTMRRLTLAMLLSPAVLLVATVYLATHPEILPSEKFLVQNFESTAPSNAQLIFVEERPFSARYYSQGKAQLVTMQNLPDTLIKQAGTEYYLAVPKKLVKTVKSLTTMHMNALYSSNQFTLLKPDVDNMQNSIQDMRN